MGEWIERADWPKKDYSVFDSGPVAPETLVEIRQIDGQEDHGPASDFCWNEEFEECDIAAYRLVELHL